MIEPIELSYALFLLPSGRVAFRRWRWELWHGPRLLAAGWRLSVEQAQRALRAHALGYAHRRHGLRLLSPERAAAAEAPWDGSAITLASGDFRVRLTPRSLEAAAAA